MTPGPKNLITDIAGIMVGNAEDQRLKSGVTVLRAAQRFTAAYAVMGGAPGTRETDLLEPDKSLQQIDALVLSGGSAYGLDAASGVVERLRAQQAGFAVAGTQVPIVPAAILFDLNNGGEKEWALSPYPALGRQAFDDLSAEFQLGSVGAGCGATTGRLKGGLGSASFILSNGIRVGAIMAVNAVGNATGEDLRRFWAGPFEANGEFGGLGGPQASPQPHAFRLKNLGPLVEGENTTIGIVATDASLSKAAAKRLALSAHDGVARALIPSHMPQDGDLIFTAATGSAQGQLSPTDMAELCHGASLCVARAIARAIYHAEKAPNDRLPTWQECNR